MADAEHNKNHDRTWIEDWNKRDRAAEAAARAPEYVAYAPASLVPTPMDSPAWLEFLDGFLVGFPDLQITVEASVGEGDLVAQRVHFEGTHTGVFQGLPPTGRRISLDGLELNRHGEDGRVLEHWFHLDALGLLQQLGLIVIPGPRLLPKLLAAPIRKLRRR
jgi:predicted ester cyclase